MWGGVYDISQHLVACKRHGFPNLHRIYRNVQKFTPLFAQFTKSYVIYSVNWIWPPALPPLLIGLPPPPPQPPPKLTLPQWFLKALGSTFVAAHKAALVPWSAQALQEGCARDQPLFSGAWHAHMTLEWVFRRLVRCQIHRHNENKGTSQVADVVVNAAVARPRSDA